MLAFFDFICFYQVCRPIVNSEWGAKVPSHFRSGERKFQGTKVLGNESTRERKFSRERKYMYVGTSAQNGLRLAGQRAVQISSQRTNSLQIHRVQIQWTITCGVQCWRLTASLKQSRKQSLNSRNRFRLSGATYHKDWSTRRWKTSQIKRLKACVGAWSCRWTLQTFTVTMTF